MKNNLGILSLCFFLCLSLSCQTGAEGGLSPGEAGSILERVLSMWNTGDLGIADSLYAPGYVRHHPMPSAAASLDDLRATVLSNRASFPDYRLAFNETFIEGDRLIVFATMTGTNTEPLGEVGATGEAVRMDGIYVFRIENGRIAEEWTYFNLLSYYQQLGYSLAPPESGTQ